MLPRALTRSSGRRAGLIALVAFVAGADPRGVMAASLAPDTVRVLAARLRRDRAGTVGTGRADVRFVLHDNASGESFITRALSDQVTVTVTDGGQFDMSRAIRGCARRGDSLLTCSDARHGVLLRLKRIQPDPAVYVGAFRARRLSAAVTGSARPTSPVTLTVRQEGGNAPADLVTACSAAGRAGLLCRDSPGPNVLVILTDDQRWDTLPYMPTVTGRLVGEGVNFTNAFVSNPVCCPSRASILTGLHSHNHGILQIVPPSGGAPSFIGPDTSTLATWLHDAGYRTGLFGKYMNGYTMLGPPEATSWYVPPGWDAWSAFPNARYYDYELVHQDGTTTAYGHDPADYSTDVLAGQVLEFIQGSIASQTPFFVYFAPFAPHVEVPSYLPIPAPRHAALFTSLPPFRPAGYDEADVSDKPARIQMRPLLTGTNFANYVDNLRVMQLRSLAAEDEAVGAMLDLLQRTGQESNTVVVFASDNGYLWGEHRIFGKEVPYEESIRVPLVIRHPPTVPAPREESRFVLNIDLAPTLAALAGVIPPTPVDGESLVPLLRNEATTWRTDVLLEHWWVGPPGGVPPTDLIGVRTETWKYVEYLGTAETELYDEVNDPAELDNRAGDPALQGIVATLHARAVELSVSRRP